MSKVVNTMATKNEENRKMDAICEIVIGSLTAEIRRALEAGDAGSARDLATAIDQVIAGIPVGANDD